MEPKDLKSLGFFGIHEEAFKIIFSWWKIFTQIALFFILPLSFIFVASMEISQIIFADISWDEIQLISPKSLIQKKNLESAVLLESIGFCLFAVAYNFLLFIVSLIATSAVVYTVACVYVNDTDINIDKVMNVVPSVLYRLMRTFLWNFIIQFGYHSAVGLLIYMVSLVFLYPLLFGILMSFYMMGFIYLHVLWHLSCVVSVLEEDFGGIKAMKKSKELIKGKLLVSSIIFTILYGFLFFVQIASLLMKDVFALTTWGVFSKVIFGVFSLLVFLFVGLIGLVIQSVIYFVCKSYHNEIIHKTSLENHLKVYLGLEEQDWKFRK